MSTKISFDPSKRFERHFQAKFEVRSEGEQSAPKVVGYAAIFGKRSENFGTRDYPLYEIISPGAFGDVLGNDVRALIDHSGGLQTLARTKSGTLKLTEDEIGLRFEFEAPNTQAGRDIVEILKRGDIDQASFAFQVDHDGQSFDDIEENGQDITIRTISKVTRLYDVSPVTYPAYPDTLVQARSVEHFIINQHRSHALKANQNARARYLRLKELEQV